MTKTKLLILQSLKYHSKMPPDSDALTDEPKAIHRTFLTKDGKKITRRMLGPAKGAAIKIDRLMSSAELSIGEGLESCLSGRLLGFFPTWAVGSAGAISTFPVVYGVEHLQIFAENDAANEQAIWDCKERWNAAGRKVTAIRPCAGSDLNDAWRGLSTLEREARAAVFLEACNRFWPGATIAPPREGPSVIDTIKRTGLGALGFEGGQ